MVAPYRDSPADRRQGAAGPSRWDPTGLVLAVVVTALLAAPVLALALQPFSKVATLVAGGAATLAGIVYTRLCLSR